MSDIDILAEKISNSFSHVSVREDYGWPRNSTLCVIDCVLSLNRNYDRVVLPRVQAFAERNPDVTTLCHLLNMLDRYPEIGEFCATELNYNHLQRELTLRGIVNYLINVQDRLEGKDEWERLQVWALSVRPSDYMNVGVRGFGLAGFQYLRMLFGAQTTKPDIHIIRYVSEILNRKVNDITALSLLESAAAKVVLPLRELDGAIWEMKARPQSPAQLPGKITL